MTKKELAELGREKALVEWARCDSDIARSDRDAVRARVSALASDYATVHTLARSTTFHDAYVATFMAEWDKAHNALPEVRAEDRRQAFLRRIERSLAETNGIDRFAKRFAENPLDAFEWAAEQAIETAAKRDVALRLKQIVEFVGDTPEATATYGGVDNAIKFGTTQALRGARWPKHSTSLLMNFLAECVTAAWAEIVADL